ncbi:MAG: hypothetical protein U9O82_11565 [Thermodesulfobacteriota bacterium]|nr:hypothetical protein [Thermodesulfobacteriota bacterium]
MKRKLYSIGVMTLGLGMLVFSSANAATLVAHSQGATLPNAPDYRWWYGCSPTSAGMMMGYYDINGYGGQTYNNLVPGATAKLSNYDNPGAAANQMIASSGHITDYYPGGNGASGDDLPRPTHAHDSLADFMGTSQDSVGNKNGETKFWNRTDGGKLYAKDIYNAGASSYNNSGMFGMWEYFDYAGYGSGSGNASRDINFFNQYTDNYHDDGFTLTDYQAEIDAGRTVMIHVEGHSMFGYDYDGTNIILHDTWTEGEHTMEWGGSYPYLDKSLSLRSVTCFTPTGGEPVPVPATCILLGSGLLGLAGLRRKSGAKKA